MCAPVRGADDRGSWYHAQEFVLENLAFFTCSGVRSWAYVARVAPDCDQFDLPILTHESEAISRFGFFLVLSRTLLTIWLRGMLCLRAAGART